MQTCPSSDDVAKACSGLLFYDRFRSSVHPDGKGELYFKTIEDFDVQRVIKTRDVSNEKELQFEVDRISKLPLDDLDKTPAWAVHLIRNTGGGVSGMVVRIHHVIGDGISLVTTMAKMFDEGALPLPDLPERKAESSGLLQTVGRFFSAVGALFSILGLAASPYDSDTKFAPGNKAALKMTSTRSLVYFPSLHLEFVKSIKNAAGVTVNDVMLAITAGAIRRYCEANKDPALLRAVQTRALVPVAFPRSSAAAKDPTSALRNYWAFISCAIPVGLPDCKKRLEACNKTMNAIKYSSAGLIQMFIQTNLLPSLPQFLRRKTAYDIFSRHSLVFSNVPGPPAPIHFCGEKILGIQVVFPNLLAQTLIVSYAGEVFMSMAIDGHVVKDGDALLPKYYLEEALALGQAYGIHQKAAEVVSKTSKEGLFSVIS